MWPVFFAAVCCTLPIEAHDAAPAGVAGLAFRVRRVERARHYKSNLILRLPNSKEPAMADDKTYTHQTYTHQQDRQRINAAEGYQLRHWARQFDVSEEQVRTAVAEVGDSVESNVVRSPTDLGGKFTLNVFPAHRNFQVFA
jgi:hypothetical protein